MTDRNTADTHNDDALDALYERLEAAEETESQRQLAAAREALASATVRAAHAEAELARLRAGEEDGYVQFTEPTPGQWLWQFNQASAEHRLNAIGALLRDAAKGRDCFFLGHEGRVHDGRHAEMALAEVRQVVADMDATPGVQAWAALLRDAMKRVPEVCLLCATEQKPAPVPSGPAATQATETVPCPACQRADQAGLAPGEQHDDCAKEQH